MGDLRQHRLGLPADPSAPIGLIRPETVQSGYKQKRVTPAHQGTGDAVLPLRP